MKTIKRSLIVLFLVLVIALLTSGVVAADRYEPLLDAFFDIIPGPDYPFPFDPITI